MSTAAAMLGAPARWCGWALRRDRIMMPVWVYALTATAVSTAYSYGTCTTPRPSRLDFAAGVRDNGSTLAFYGQIYDPSSVGGLTAWRLVGDRLRVRGCDVRAAGRAAHPSRRGAGTARTWSARAWSAGTLP